MRKIEMLIAFLTMITSAVVVCVGISSPADATLTILSVEVSVASINIWAVGAPMLAFIFTLVAIDKYRPNLLKRTESAFSLTSLKMKLRAR